MGEQPDKARPSKLTAKQRQTGLARLGDPSASEGEVARRGGYSPWTARKPSESGIDSLTFAQQVALEDGIKPAQARKLGLRVLAQLAADPDEPGGTRGAAAKELLQFAENNPEPPTATTPRVLRLRIMLRRATDKLAVLDLLERYPTSADRLRDRLLTWTRRWAKEYQGLTSEETALDERSALMERLNPGEAPWWLSVAGIEAAANRARRKASSSPVVAAVEVEVVGSGEPR